MRLTRRYEFCASHRLHQPSLSETENEGLYGKCNNPYGHGHNYALEVTVRGPVNQETGLVLDSHLLDELVRAQVMEPMDHRNLNAEVEEFADVVPTSENLVLVIEQRLRSEWHSRFPGGQPRLENVRLYETRRNRFDLSL